MRCVHNLQFTDGFLDRIVKCHVVGVENHESPNAKLLKFVMLKYHDKWPNSLMKWTYLINEINKVISWVCATAKFKINSNELKQNTKLAIT